MTWMTPYWQALHNINQPAERHVELTALLTDIPPPVRRDVVTLWWDRP